MLTNIIEKGTEDQVFTCEELEGLKLDAPNTDENSPNIDGEDSSLPEEKADNEFDDDADEARYIN